MAYPNNNGKPIFNQFITPIGLITHCAHDKPLKKINEKTRMPILDENGIEEAEYRVTLAWEKQRLAELQELIDLAQRTKGEAWPESLNPGAFFALETFFRDGDDPRHNTMKRDYLFGHYYLNFKSKATGSRNPVNGQILYSGAPGLVDQYGQPMLPLDLYSGCTARCSGIMFGTEYLGKNFISTRLNNIQKADDGTRLGNVRPDAQSQFGPLPGYGGSAGGKMRDVL
jgi:hypothetical protein